MGHALLSPVVAALVLVPLSGCASLQTALLYHPTPFPREPELLTIGTQEMILRATDDSSIDARWYPCEGAKGALLFCHGNAGNLAIWGGVAKSLGRALDQSVLIFDYPGYGRSSGRPDERGCYAAGQAAFDWLVQVQGYQPQQIVIYGESLGGGIALELASRRPYRALCLVRTFTSIPDMAGDLFPWLSVQWLVTDRFDNLKKMGLCAGPVFIAHGTADQLIPYAHGQRLFAAAREPRQFLLMQGIGHNDPLPEAFMATLRQFLEAHAPL
jgi:fermentation-respiration switch protein FrsA (DUF1100 family)